MFVKLFQKMLDSSIWLESDSTVRVWVTLLLSMDSEGFAQFASIENLARRARVKPSLTARAIAVLEAPDPDSTTPDDEGRRIRRVHGGWQVVNCRKYREIAKHGDLRATRCKPAQLGSTQRNSDQRGLPTDLSSNGISESLPETEKEIEKEEEIKTPPPILKPIPIPTKPDSAADVVHFVMQGVGLSGREMFWLAEDALKLAMKSLDVPAMGAAAHIVSEWAEYDKTITEFKCGPDKFLKTGLFLSRSRWRANANKAGKFTQLLNSVSEPYCEPGEQFGTAGDRQS